ncbi:hypothetical protein [uncultured Winogradskyella sp.]|uniref:hypothetical protein n=1 Tax=uncultured Winogradskyella sp. TaxID=395353 RepID=UPI002637EF82|nr:hypothetical protein [uncultured Winogradskyella sp.]
MQKQQNFSAKACKMLNVDIQDVNRPWLTSIETLMKLIGVLGMLLPILLWLFLYLNTGRLEELPSISHYFFTRSNPVFIIVVSLMAIFLMIYKRHKPIDFFLSFLAGFAALLVLLFPTDSIATSCCNVCDTQSMTYIKESGFRVKFHYISAAVFLSILNYMCFFLFTKSDQLKANRTPEKKKRNLVYIVCGSLMLIALLIMFSYFIDIFPKAIYENNNLTFWMETLAVESFGFSWLVKGGFILKDK